MLSSLRERGLGNSTTKINKKTRFRVRDGYIILVETDDSRRVVNENKLAAMAHHEPCPPQEDVMATARLKVTNLGGNLDGQVFVMIFTQSL